MIIAFSRKILVDVFKIFVFKSIIFCRLILYFAEKKDNFFV